MPYTSFPPVHAFAHSAHRVEKCGLSPAELIEYRAALAKLEPELKRAAGEGVGLELLQGFDLSVPKGRIPHEDELKKLCQRGRMDTKINHSLIQNGCAERAHIFAHELRERGINVEKVFVEPGPGGRLGPGHGRGFWNYHAGVLVFVRAAGKVEPRVVDLAFSPEPMRFEEWFPKFNLGRSLEITFQHRRQLRPPWCLEYTQDTFKETLKEARRELKAVQREELGLGPTRAVFLAESAPSTPRSPTPPPEERSWFSCAVM
jgi:hypothetical protein